MRYNFWSICSGVVRMFFSQNMFCVGTAPGERYRIHDMRKLIQLVPGYPANKQI